MYRFGAFQVDPRAHELIRDDIRIKIQEQPFVVLLKLLEHPGELVPREELRRALWPADTFVDFDTGLNTVIKRLREALRDPPRDLSSSRRAEAGLPLHRSVAVVDGYRQRKSHPRNRRSSGW